MLLFCIFWGVFFFFSHRFLLWSMFLRSVVWRILEFLLRSVLFLLRSVYIFLNSRFRQRSCKRLLLVEQTKRSFVSMSCLTVLISIVSWLFSRCCAMHSQKIIFSLRCLLSNWNLLMLSLLSPVFLCSLCI